MAHHERSRRSFLRGALCAAGAGTMAAGWLGGLSRLASAADTNPAAPTAPRFYVFAYFSGGWDILLSLDPRDPLKFNAGNMALTKIQPAYGLLDDDSNDGSPVTLDGGAVLGPYIGDLAQHFDKTAILRGLSMDTLTHEVGRRRFLTGKPPSGLLARGSSGATWLASQLGAEQPIPNLSVNVETYNVDQPNYATGLRVASVPDLVRSLKRGEPLLEGELDELVDQLLAQDAQCPAAMSSPAWQTAEASRGKAREMVSSGFESLFDFQAKTAEMAVVRDHYGIAATGVAALRSPEAQAAMAATALTAGISRCVSFQAASGLDTHYDEWSTEQGPTQERGFNAVARLIEDLAAREYQGTGTSWLDHTVILGFSEFSRGALMNTRGGRDHALLNAAFVSGGPIQGGQIIGASSDVGMNPTPTHLSTGLPDPNGEIVKPEHVIRALLQDIGLTDDVADLRADPLLALLKSP